MQCITVQHKERNRLWWCEVNLLLQLLLEMKDKRQAWRLASAHTCFNSFVTEELNWFYIIEFFRCYELIIWVPNRFKLSAVSAAYPHNILQGGHTLAPVIPSVKWRTTSFLSNLALTTSKKALPVLSTTHPCSWAGIWTQRGKKPTTPLVDTHGH